MRHRWNKLELHLHYWKILRTASTNAPRRSKIGLHALKLVKAIIATVHFATLTLYLAILRTHFATLRIDLTILKVYFDILTVHFATLTVSSHFNGTFCINFHSNDFLWN